jgi:hypothetical protein
MADWIKLFGERGNSAMDELNERTFILSVDDLTKAIRTSIDHRGMEEDAAHEMAQHVLNFFGFNDRIIDNVLEPEDRDAFYMLEDSGLLTTEREETTLYDGREWRIHYWLFKTDRIIELVRRANAKEKSLIEAHQSVYAEIPEEAWQRSNGLVNNGM